MSAYVWCGQRHHVCVQNFFVRHLDALHPSCVALLATTLWRLMSDTPVMQCDAQNAGSQVKVMAFNGPPYSGVR